MRNLKKGFKLFFATLRGEEFVPKSPVGDEELVGFAHPDGPVWATRREVYYGASIFGTGAKFELRR